MATHIGIALFLRAVASNDWDKSRILIAHVPIKICRSVLGADVNKSGCTSRPRSTAVDSVRNIGAQLVDVF